MRRKKSSWPRARADGADLVRALVAAALLTFAPLASAAESAAPPAPPPIERNVVYGMVSGAALLLDVHRPARSNGLGVIFIDRAAIRPRDLHGV